VRSWTLNEIETPGGSVSPVVVHSGDAARAVLIRLEPGQELGEHQVKEDEFVVVLEGTVRAGGKDEQREAGPGTLLYFEPEERRIVSSKDGARLLLVLAPWPGEGHFRKS
jgi:quercetin dioxygenase-like cupin family protein